MPEDTEGWINYVQRVYGSETNDEPAPNYDAWAQTCDSGAINNWGR